MPNRSDGENLPTFFLPRRLKSDRHPERSEGSRYGEENNSSTGSLPVPAGVPAVPNEPLVGWHTPYGLLFIYCYLRV